MNINTTLFILSVLVLLGLAYFCFNRKAFQSEDAPMILWKRTPFLVIWLLIMMFLLPCVGSVPSGSRGIVYQWGKITDRIIPEGLYLVRPVAERVTIVSVMERSQTFGEKAKISAQSKDGQEEFLQVTVNYQLKADKVTETYRTIGPNWEDTVLRSPVQEAIRVAATAYDAFDAPAQRMNIGRSAKNMLQKRLDEKNAGIDITIVTIDNIGYSQQFEAALDNQAKLMMDRKAAETKVATVEAEGRQKVAAATAEADATRAKAKGEADARITSATAEATANDLLNKSLTTNVIAWKKLAINEEIAAKWGGTVPSTILSSGSYLPLIDLGK